ncbi:hypothetical protein STCU_00287 [Strigomonas culicis]|uniref:Uncharacterized protein n=1 Tax=Strigomonas culicis TaxID=28005 RepID=S9WCZ9_9TRYP|nr:hypothetical protein STCU_00287 [Strigomonas culicis]|eukprot:EPY37011.1 hypothetical protein STCU_00287 [Strigomonas culicis]
MDQIATRVSSAVNTLESLRLPVFPYDAYIKTVLVCVPIAVLLHDTAEYWLHPENEHCHVLQKVPVVRSVINFFARRWREEPEVKHTHLLVARNIILFAFFVIVQMDEAANEPVQPSEYVEQRLKGATGAASLNREIQARRAVAYNAADAVLGEEETNVAGVQQQRDAVLRRRHLKDSRMH